MGNLNPVIAPSLEKMVIFDCPHLIFCIFDIAFILKVVLSDDKKLEQSVMVKISHYFV